MSTGSDPLTVRTLARPPGARLATVATVNDVHFGETRCGYIAGLDLGPVLAVGSDEVPYPLVMNTAAIEEIMTLAPDAGAVVVKGDLTAAGTPQEYAEFHRVVRPPLRRPADRDPGQPRQPACGVRTTRPAAMPGGRARRGDPGGPRHLPARPHRAVKSTPTRPSGWTSWPPGLIGRSWCSVIIRRPSTIAGWRPYSGRVPWPGVAFPPPRLPAWWLWCSAGRRWLATSPATPTGTNDAISAPQGLSRGSRWRASRTFPGAGPSTGCSRAPSCRSTGVSSRPDAVAWSERCRALYAGLYPDYAWGALQDRCFQIPLREPGG